jgi:hypothetical protein
MTGADAPIPPPHEREVSPPPAGSPRGAAEGEDALTVTCPTVPRRDPVAKKGSVTPGMPALCRKAPDTAG